MQLDKRAVFILAMAVIHTLGLLGGQVPVGTVLRIVPAGPVVLRSFPQLGFVVVGLDEKPVEPCLAGDIDLGGIGDVEDIDIRVLRGGHPDHEPRRRNIMYRLKRCHDLPFFEFEWLAADDFIDVVPIRDIHVGARLNPWKRALDLR